MIRHICMFTLKEDNREKNIIEFFERAEKLRELEIIKQGVSQKMGWPPL